MVRYESPRFIGIKRRATRYVLCLENKGYPASLEPGKFYRSVPDRDAEKHLMRRIIDESGEDYLYPHRWFIEVRLPPAVRRALSSIDR